jgi:hypothetical protein
MKLAFVPVQSGRAGFPEAVEPFPAQSVFRSRHHLLPAFSAGLGAADRKRRRAGGGKIYDHIGGRSPIFEETRARPMPWSGAVQGRRGSQSLCRHALLAPVQRWRGAGGKGFQSRQIVLVAALSAIFHHHHGVLAQGLGAGRAKAG